MSMQRTKKAASIYQHLDRSRKAWNDLETMSPVIPPEMDSLLREILNVRNKAAVLVAEIAVEEGVSAFIREEFPLEEEQ